jgi:geranylgeranyl diphosphate synthase type II
MPLPERFREYAEMVDQYLDRHLPGDNAPPEPIYRAMRYSLFAGGKRLRPVLCLAGAESLYGQAETMLPVGAAVEMIHTYSLIHDDLPAMDNDDFRRGKPTSHKAFGEAIAVLAGDALLTAGLETLSRADYDPAVRCRLIRLLTAAAGTEGMIGGQVLDMVNENKTLTRDQLDQLHAKKTGAILRFCTLSAPVVLGRGPEIEQIFLQYGSLLGLAFQITDDILDVVSTTEKLGKTAGKDEKEKKATYPSILGLEESRRTAGRLIDQACALISPHDPRSYLRDLALYVVERDH